MYMDGVDHSFKETDEAAVILNTRPEWRLMCGVIVDKSHSNNRANVPLCVYIPPLDRVWSLCFLFHVVALIVCGQSNASVYAFCTAILI